MRVLYRDPWLLAIDKPADLPSQATPDPNRDHALAAVTRWLTQTDGRPPAYVVLPHRLDRDTTGVLLLALHRDANAGLARAFSSHIAQKTYVAACETAPDLPDAWQVDNHLLVKKVGKHGTRTEAVRSGGDRAITDFRVLHRGPRTIIVEAQPRTGRTHQIRAHLGQGGTPILGDRLYGAGRGPWADRVLLHARVLELPHPVTAAPLRIEAPLPDDLLRWFSVAQGTE